MPDSLTAYFVADIFSIKKEQAESINDRRRALTWCLNNEWKGEDLEALERVDKPTEKMFGWAMWLRGE